MDSFSSCNTNSIISLNYGQKVTVKGKQSTFFTSTSGPLSCVIKFQSDGGFEVDFDKGWIQTSGVTLTLYSGAETTSPVWVSQLHLHLTSLPLYTAHIRHISADDV